MISEEKSGRDYAGFHFAGKLLHNAEGAVAINFQAKGPDFDETLESKGAPKKEIFQVDKTEAYLYQNI